MSSKRVIGIIVFDGFLTSEVIAPAEVFGIAQSYEWFKDWSVSIIGVEQQEMVRSQEGICIGVDNTIDDNLTVDVLIVPGAYEMDHLYANEKLNAYIKKHEDSAQWVSSNCSGAFLLAHSGVLDGVTATTWFGGEAKLQEQFPLVKVVFDKPVVIDGRRLTSNGNVVSYQAAIILLGKLSSPDHAKQVYNHLSISRLDSWDSIAKQIAS